MKKILTIIGISIIFLLTILWCILTWKPFGYDPRDYESELPDPLDCPECYDMDKEIELD